MAKHGEFSHLAAHRDTNAIPRNQRHDAGLQHRPSPYHRTSSPLAHIKGSRVNMSPAQLLGTVPANSFHTLGVKVEVVEQHTIYKIHWRTVAPPDTIQSENVTVRRKQAAESTGTNVNRQAGNVAATAAARERARAAIQVARQALENLRAFEGGFDLFRTHGARAFAGTARKSSMHCRYGTHSQRGGFLPL
jgi:hypothetical protein